MNATSTIDRPHGGLLAWLTDRGIEHEVHTHPGAFTARATADAEGVDARTFAKVVGVATADGRQVLLVLDATDRVDLRNARRALETDEVRLLSEVELAAVAPDCEAGALPAVGPLFGLPMYADFAVRDDPEISFNAGTHRSSVRVDRAAWEAATGVVYADLAADDEGPVWARS